MYSKNLTESAQEIISHFDGLKRVELQALTEKTRLYPDGFEFSRDVGEKTEKFRVLSAFVSGAELLDAQIFYHCEVWSWMGWSKCSQPISEFAISSFVKHFSQPVGSGKIAIENLEA
jgi:hypothetical protein